MMSSLLALLLDQPPVGNLGAPLRPLSHQPPRGSLGSPLAAPTSAPSAGQPLTRNPNSALFAALGIRVPRPRRATPFSDAVSFDDRPVDTTWGRSSMNAGVGPGLGMGFGPVNPYGLESSDWRDVGQGALALLTGGATGLIQHGIQQWSQNRGGGSGPGRHVAGALGGLLGLPLATGYDLATGIRGSNGGG